MLKPQKVLPRLRIFFSPWTSLCWAGRSVDRPASCRSATSSTTPGPKHINDSTLSSTLMSNALELTSSTASEKEVSSPIDPSRRYILLYELAKQVRSSIALRFELINVFLPSRDTTAALMSNFFFQLSRYPSYWTQLRHSALSLPFDPTDPSSLSFSTLKSLLPFRYVIQETLRTLGPAGRVFRAARHDTTLPRGGGPDGNAPVFVPRGTTVCSLTYHIHHDRDIWGEDSDTFRPERWTEGNKGGWEFVPFLGGPRICPAQQQVLIQATYLLLRVVREFDWIENRDETEEYIELQKMAIESRGGVKIALRPEGKEFQERRTKQK